MDDREKAFDLILWIDTTTSALMGKVDQDTWQELRRKHHDNVAWLVENGLEGEYYNTTFYPSLERRAQGQAPRAAHEEAGNPPADKPAVPS